MDLIKLENIRVYSYHGCLEEEAIIGSDYRVDVTVGADLGKASLSDQLSDTIDYVHINRIVKEEMAIRSKLLEHVAKRIIDRLFAELELLLTASVTVAKINPPIGGDVQSVQVVLEAKRS
ncbi:dihydroneopterin aldolase [Poritiphilus flavus]|uniref:7,8-dihydroneopterin aldolase n=1 Tax=Poritiphilus flavus TaxID=2697053 RepID=A0A6L9E8H7_9FLAO|nr:dihydroneopterin aldolase [Poritiphilus flavus]NAS11010.1 dihydroneopterin aldolase [Poritiphilus flavus]